MPREVRKSGEVYTKQLEEEVQAIVDESSQQECTKEQEERLGEILVKRYLAGHQLELVDSYNEYFGVGLNVINPIYDPYSLTCLKDKNTRLNQSIELRARNTVGMGWRLQPNQVFYDEILPMLGIPEIIINRFAKREKFELVKLFSRPNARMRFLNVTYNIKVDQETTGNGYAQIVRDRGGKITAINHLPSHTIRIVCTGGYVQCRRINAQWYRNYYKEFGDPRIMDRDNGMLYGPDTKEGRAVPYDKRANEVIHFKLYTPRDSWYGMPRWISAMAAIMGNRLCAERNMSFFENDAVGRLAVIVQGGHLDEQSVKGIRDFVNREGKGTNNAHRVMILQGEQKKVLGVKNENTKIELQPLTIGESDDASHLKYQNANNEEVRESFGMSSAFYTTSGEARGNVEESVKMTIRQQFEPDVADHEFVWNSTVVKFRDYSVNEAVLACLDDPEDYRFINPIKLSFCPLQIEDKMKQSEILAIDTKMGSKTMNEVRREQGLPPYPQSFAFGNLPLSFAMLLFNNTIAASGGMPGQGTKPSAMGQNIKPGNPKTNQANSDDYSTDNHSRDYSGGLNVSGTKTPVDLENLQKNHGAQIINLRAFSDPEKQFEYLMEKIQEVAST